MIQRIEAVSPVLKARIAGAFYLLSIITGIVGATLPDGPISLAANLAGNTCYVAVTLILYDLLKPVNAKLSLLAAAFSLIGCVLGFLGFLHLPKPPINELVFFGCYCLLLAYLIFTSTFLPKFLTILLALTGIGWLTFIDPPLGERLFSPYLMIGGLAGEGSLTLWLLIVGVNAPRWNEQAQKARQ
jgi:hypothetical protein